MENAIWNGRLYTATEIKDSYELEKEIRMASGRKEILCPDPDCPSPILRYCHGEQRFFFAHLNNCSCDYAEFDRENTPLMREAKYALYHCLSSKGFNVQLEVKLVPHHYTHLLVTLPTGQKVAIEFGSQATTANRVDFLSKQYSYANIFLKWIIISNAQNPVKENETFFIKRHSLNVNKNKDVLIFNKHGNEVTQYIVDPTRYLYKGIHEIRLNNYPDIYCETGFLDSLTFEHEEITIAGFYQRYYNWLTEKKIAIENKMAQMEEEERIRKKKLENGQPERKPIIDFRVGVPYATPNNMTYETRRASVLPRMNQQTEQVRDETDARWIRCQKCGAVETDDKFAIYGGIYGMNSGVCKKCSRGS